MSNTNFSDLFVHVIRYLCSCVISQLQVQAGRRLIPTALGVSLIRGYQCIDPDLCLPDIRSFIEKQITLVSKGQADYSLVVRHVLAQFQQKFSYFVKKVQYSIMMNKTCFLAVTNRLIISSL